MREILVENMRRIGLDAYEVGGCIRDELLGKEAKDIDFAVCGVSYDDLARMLHTEGVVEPNIVGGGRVVGIRVLGPSGDSEHFLAERESYRHLAERLRQQPGELQPIVKGDGRLVGCRLFARWAPQDGIEISLARTERSTATGRSNFKVETNADLTIIDDLSRRDFTVNAIARSVHTGEIIDPFDGTSDVASKVLRVLNDQSFSDDPSRILRGLVRVAKDGFRPDDRTREQMTLHADKLAAEPTEQIYLELDRLLAGNYAADALRIGAATGALQAALPELAPIVGFEQESRYHDLTCDEHTFRVVEEACQRGANQVVRWAALFHDVGKPATSWRGKDGHLHFYRNPDDPDSKSHEELGATITRAALNRMLQPSKEFREDVSRLVAEHMYGDDHKLRPLRARRFIQRVGRDHVDDLMLLRRCDRAGKGSGPLPADQDLELRAWEELVEEQRNQPLVIVDLAVSGYDVMSFGFKDREIGGLLRELLRVVTDDPELNTRERLLSIVARRAVKEGKLTEDDAATSRIDRLGVGKEEVQ